jgi:hypothetical protein
MELEMERKGFGGRLISMGYVAVVFWMCYVVTLLASGVHNIAEDGLSFEINWPRSVFSVLSIVIAALVFWKFYRNDKNIRDTLGSPFVLHVLGISTFILSVGASIFSNQIQSVITEWALREGDLLPSGEVTFLIDEYNPFIFFISSIITILALFLFHGYEANRMKKALEAEQKKQSKELRNAIRVAPPPYFTKMLADVTDQSEDFLSSVTDDYALMEEAIKDPGLDNKTKIGRVEESIELQRKSIRAVLTGFGRLARTYDNVNPLDKNEKVEYRANLMLNLERNSEAFEVLFPNALPKVRFSAPFGAEPNYYLVIDRRLSVRIGVKPAEIYVASPDNNGGSEVITPADFTSDSKVKDALLPVYWSQNDQIHHNFNMIGAPTAIVDGKDQFIADSIASIEQATQYNAALKKEANDYFQADDKGRSIVSFPVATRHFKTATALAPEPRLYFGAINLYRNEKDIFSGDIKNFKFFSDFTRPMNLIMGRMAYTHIGALFQLYYLKNPTK